MAFQSPFMTFALQGITRVLDLNARIDEIIGEHPGDHEYVDNRHYPGTCQKCSHVKSDTPCDCGCGRTMIEHLQLEKISA